MLTINSLLGFSLVVLASTHVHGAAILSSNFDAHGSTDGSTSFTGINWITNGVSTPGSTVAIMPGMVQTNGSLDNLNRLAVDRNIDTAGLWEIDIAFTALVSGITLEDVTFDYQFISGNGSNQAAAHPDSGVVQVVLLNGAANHGFTGRQIGPLGTSDPASNSGTDVLADFNDFTLTNGDDYILRFQVSSNANSGNNFALDNFSLNGSIIPEPSSAALLGLGGLALLLRRRT